MNITDKHPNFTSVTAIILMFVTSLMLALLTGCKTSKVVEVTKTDTLHVYHTDTMKVVHNDTIYSIVTQVVHDSIVKETIIKEVVNEAGEVIHSEKETNNETFHNSVGYSQLIQHTVDSLLKVKIDSIYHSAEKPVVVEVEKKNWWDRVRIRWGEWTMWVVVGLAIGWAVYVLWKYIRPRV